jgi:hypothetical protein
MLASSIFKEHKVPATPVCSHPGEKMAVRYLVPLPADPQRHISAGHIDCPVQNPPLVTAAERHRDLLANSSITVVQRRRFGDDGFIQHQQDRPHAIFQAVFEPPFACRHVWSRRAKRWRGRFQRMPSLRKARPMLLVEVTRP